MADGSYLEMPNCKNKEKNQNWLHAEIIVTQTWYDSTEIFSVSHLVDLSYRSHFDWTVIL